MTKACLFLQEINRLLDELIEVARSLELLSRHQITAEEEKEISRLQFEQDMIINQILKLDEQLNQEFPNIKKEKIEERELVHRKMTEFENLNRRFIDNIEGRSGLIKFD
ncbi:MAG: hypothetical protein ACSNEK_05720 [Parachlamydiaceae bacterium]